MPHTVVNNKYKLSGLLPDAPFIRFLLKLDPKDLGQVQPALLDDVTEITDAEREAADPGKSSVASAQKEFHVSVETYGVTQGKGDEFNPDLLILGGGPAGLTAAMYAARAGLSVTVLDSGMLGGQVPLTQVVENFPGFKNISGAQLADNFIAQAAEYAHLRGNMQITNLENKNGGFIASTSNGLYHGRALLIATGASWRKLNVPGEAALSGRGVHYCASCDGYMYTGKKILVIGGGNTALTDALHLNNLGIEVTIVHRRDEFRAEMALANAVKKHGLKVLWNTVVLALEGQDKLTGVRLRNVQSKEETAVDTDAVFVSVGQSPNSRPALAVGAKLAADGSIIVDDKKRSTTPLVYAAGDVTGGFQQIVSAVAAGALAANTAFEDLQKG